MDGGPHTYIRSTPLLDGAQRDVYFSRGEAVSTFGCSLEPCVLAAGSQRSPLASSMDHAARTEI